jgi:hypothetical protein
VPCGGILEHNALGQQFVANAVGLGEVTGFLGCRPGNDLLLDAGFVEPGARLQEGFRVTLQQAQYTAQRLEQPGHLGRLAAVDLGASSNNTATASGVAKSLSIAALKRAAWGCVQSMSTAAGVTASSAVYKRLSALRASSRCTSL